MEQVEETPHDDGVVVEGHHEGRHCACDADATHERVDLVPHSNTALTELLSNGQFEVQKGHALHKQHDKVGDEERS